MIWIVGASKYKIVRCRFKEDINIENEYQILVFGLCTEVTELTGDNIWYYNFVGGAYFPDTIEGRNSTYAFVRDYFQKIYIDDIYEYIYIVMLWNKTTDGTLFLLTKKVNLYQSTEIVIKGIDFDNEKISISRKEMNWILDAYFNFI